MSFMDNYEGNKDRTDRWIATFPQGRLEAHIVEFNAEKGYVLIQAKAWRLSRGLSGKNEALDD
jgi:hypothetical protein